MQNYRICTSKIVYEVLNTEVIAIDFHTGNYYAIIHVGKQIWQLLEQHLPLDRISQAISDHYRCDRNKVLSDIQQFMNELLRAGLIEMCPPEPFTDPIPFAEEGWEYDTPRLQEYTDVQNLLLLDPIHEVTDAGWPKKLESTKS